MMGIRTQFRKAPAPDAPSAETLARLLDAVADDPFLPLALAGGDPDDRRRASLILRKRFGV